eukprot:3768969-Rhodomonas_salina.1
MKHTGTNFKFETRPYRLGLETVRSEVDSLSFRLSPPSSCLSARALARSLWAESSASRAHTSPTQSNATRVAFEPPNRTRNRTEPNQGCVAGRCAISRLRMRRQRVAAMVATLCQTSSPAAGSSWAKTWAAGYPTDHALVRDRYL